ncbi:MAG: ribosome small subunit-dependent GTPase A [Muribaculum sp.]|nr:ribosome small subunit-dependent GTPase A [Muribaculum sp.]
MQGKIIRGIAGFYYVHAKGTAEGGRVYECKAKGIFRKDHRKPLVGDDVEFQVLDEEKALGNITAILPRHSELIRPAVANVDQALVIFAIVKPQPNFNLLDRFLIMMERQGLPAVICFNKLDMDVDGQGERYREIYEQCGYHTLLASADSRRGVDELRETLAGKTTTVAGPSGVGKSSLVNCLQDQARMQTGSISEKIDRGRHTTRHTELIAMAADTYILDTPGFSSLGLFELAKEELSSCYPEFARFEERCQFAGCAHMSEPVCGVKDAVESGAIPRMRYENYCLLYEELRQQRRY